MNHNPYAPPKANVDGVPVGTSASDEPDPSTPLYTANQIGVASFVGSPIAAAWFAAANYKALGEPLKAKRTLIWGVAVTVTLMGIAYMLPDRTPNSLLPIAYSVAIRIYAEQVFGGMVAYHLKRGGTRGSWWRVVGISLLFTLAIAALVFVVMILLFTLGILKA